MAASAAMARNLRRLADGKLDMERSRENYVIKPIQISCRQYDKATS
jgi:hypothetical protein